MFRSGAPRGLFRSLNAAALRTTATASARPALRSQLCTVGARSRTNVLSKPLALRALQLIRHQSGNRTPIDSVDTSAEEKLRGAKLPADPSVSLASSVHPVLGEVGGDPVTVKETEMLAGVKHDMKTIQETFSLEGVPHQAYYIGLAGVLPYVATSLSTVYCAYEIHHAAEFGTGLIMSGNTAELLLHVLEPLQVGYGATIISFLGAIHWGLEWAAYGGTQGYPRYFIGVAAAGLAWPTVLLPVEYALISQFLVFNFLYYNDSRASKRGWAPPWYGVYRFVLTFIVGSSIVVSLIGRSQIADRIKRPHGPADRLKQLTDAQYDGPEDSAARKRLLKDDDDEEEGGDDDDE